MYKNIIFLLTLSLLTACNGCDKCPFKPIEYVKTHERTETSVDFVVKATAALPMMPKIANAKVAGKIAADLSYLSDQIRDKPIDEILASNYNCQIDYVCGLYDCIKDKELPETTRQDCGEEFSKAIIALRKFLTAYKDKRPLPLLGPAAESPCTGADELQSQITDYIKSKVDAAKDNETRFRWQKLLNANDDYLNNCLKEPNCHECLEGYFKDLKSLDNVTSLIKKNLNDEKYINIDTPFCLCSDCKRPKKHKYKPESHYCVVQLAYTWSS
jgi:hypothetical protein